MLMLGTGFWMIIIVHLLGCVSPGPDFIVVVRNALSYRYRIAVFTVLGVSTGILMHTSYCALGLGVVLVKIPGLFHLLRILGAAYLFYLSIKIFFTKAMIPTVSQQADAKTLTAWQAYRLGFFTNALNPKAMLFILGIFIMVAKFDNPWWSLFFVLEMTLVTGLWFLLLAHCFSRPRFKAKLIAIQGGIAKCLAVFLSVFAIQLLLSTGVK